MSFSGSISEETVQQIRLSLELDLNEQLYKDEKIPYEVYQCIRHKLEQSILKGGALK